MRRTRWASAMANGSPPSLLMLGASVANSLGQGRGPTLRYCTAEELSSIKRPSERVLSGLRGLADRWGGLDCWVWNTCNRFEVYALDRMENGDLIRILRQTLFENVGPVLNQLHGVGAVHHFVRTCLGLNSGLPGETDVRFQLLSALALSRKRRLLSPAGEGFVEALLELTRKARSKTAWQEFRPSYCLVALQHVLERSQNSVGISEPVVLLGSSNTSRSCMRLLNERFGVPADGVTIFHRSNRRTGDLKALRRSTPGCRLQRTVDYDDNAVLEAIAGASLVVAGIDGDAPLFRIEEVEERRGSKRLLFIDFNSFGTLQGTSRTGAIRLFNAAELEAGVRSYGDRLSRSSGFLQALEEVEDFIDIHIEKDPSTALSQALASS